MLHRIDLMGWSPIQLVSNSYIYGKRKILAVFSFKLVPLLLFVFITIPLCSHPLSLRRTTMKCSTCGPRKAPSNCQIQRIYPGLYGLLSVLKKISPQDRFAGQIQEQNDFLNISSFGELFHRAKSLSITLYLD